jgi:hypothetical protein
MEFELLEEEILVLRKEPQNTLTILKPVKMKGVIKSALAMGDLITQTIDS